MTTDSQSPFRFNDDQPVTQWLRQLEAGDHEAARRLWKQYFDEVARLAGKRMGNASRRVIDEEDVALSVMRCLYEGAVRGHFTAPGEAATDKTASCGPSNVSTS